MILSTIRQKTGRQHIAVEKKIENYINGLDNSNDYLALLRLFYGYMNPVEELVTAHVEKQFIPDMEERRNSKLLLKDIEEIGIPGEINYCTELPTIKSNAQAIGALYVLEGSTLGGGIIAKKVAAKLQIAEGLNYFNNYGTERSAMWKQFCSYLEHPGLQESEEEIAAGAEETFAAFGKWVEANKRM